MYPKAYLILVITVC